MSNIVDTTWLQMRSLTEVMKAVGFRFCHFRFNFYNVENPLHQVSFKSAVEFHNSLEDIIVEYDFLDTLKIKIGAIEINLYDLNRALGAQIVERVKIQLNKKPKILMVQNHAVKFVVKNYYKLFLGN